MGAIGFEAMAAILDVTEELRALIRENFEPYEGLHRLNDTGEYVTSDDFESVWEGYPSWWFKAWMLADNGQYSSDDVAAMSVEEIEAAFSDPDFFPEYAFYTEVCEDGSL